MCKPRLARLILAARECSGTKLCFPHQNAGQQLSDLVNFTSGIIFSKYHVRCNGIRACFTGKYHTLDTLNWEE